MADTVTSQTLVDGPLNAVMRFTNISDGTGEAAVTKVTVSALSGVPAHVVITRIDWACAGMGVDLLWDATADVLAHHLGDGTSGTLDFEKFGGLQNPKTAGFTGDIKLTTLGHSAGDRYSITLYMRKKAA